MQTASVEQSTKRSEIKSIFRKISTISLGTKRQEVLCTINEHPIKIMAISSRFKLLPQLYAVSAP
jgi:hypothetical protein